MPWARRWIPGEWRRKSSHFSIVRGGPRLRHSQLRSINLPFVICVAFALSAVVVIPALLVWTSDIWARLFGWFEPG